MKNKTINSKKSEKIKQKKPLILKSVYSQIKGMAWNGIYDHKYIIIEKGEKNCVCLFLFFYSKKKKNNNFAVPSIYTHPQHSMATITTFAFKLFNI